MRSQISNILHFMFGDFTEFDTRRRPDTLSSTPLLFIFQYQNKSFLTFDLYPPLVYLFFVPFRLIPKLLQFSIITGYLLWVDSHHNDIFGVFDRLYHNVAIANKIDFVTADNPRTFLNRVDVGNTFFLFLRFTNQRIFQH